jgi:hypothetical protein
MEMHFLRLKSNDNYKLKIAKCGWESWVTLQSVFLGLDHHNLGHVKISSFMINPTNNYGFFGRS